MQLFLKEEETEREREKETERKKEREREKERKRERGRVKIREESVNASSRRGEFFGREKHKCVRGDESVRERVRLRC